jgi:hypothetical protein
VEKSRDSGLLELAVENDRFSEQRFTLDDSASSAFFSHAAFSAADKACHWAAIDFWAVVADVFPTWQPVLERSFWKRL